VLDQDRLIQGFGINDLSYTVSTCPFYKRWAEMLRRCYSAAYHKQKPSYIGTKTHDDWKYASAFKSWMQNQDWEGRQLDKDLLVPNNKIYSPETCVFLSPLVNSFLTERSANRGDYPLGVHKYFNKFAASCNNLGGKRIHLGYFYTQEEAHLAWKRQKHEIACSLAEKETDVRIIQALITRYL